MGIITGGNTPGTAAEASRMSTINSRERGCPLAAMAPMFQITDRP